MCLFSVSVDELDKYETRAVNAESSTRLITFSLSNDESFKVYQNFFAAIGYMAHQVALIEDNIRQSMISLTKDYDVVMKETNNKNLGSLLSLYELVYLSGLNKGRKKEWFYFIKPYALKVNKYRNEAVHSQWNFINGDPELPCYEKKDNYVIITPLKMKQRANFAHEVFALFDDLRAAVEGPIIGGWDCNVILDSIDKLDSLVS